MLNSVTIQGRITKELKPTRTQNEGVPMLRFTLACESDRKDQQGNRDADFINCMAFNKTVDMMTKYLHKGSKIIVHGRWVTSQSQGQGGQQRQPGYNNNGPQQGNYQGGYNGRQNYNNAPYQPYQQPQPPQDDDYQGY